MVQEKLSRVSAKPELLGVIEEPLFENLGALANLAGQTFFLSKVTFYLSVHASILKVFEECPLL